MSREDGNDRVKYGACVVNGTCCDCAQGIIGRVIVGFEYFDPDNNGGGFWLCRYCGSNHVTVVIDTGTVVEQDSLY